MKSANASNTLDVKMKRKTNRNEKSKVDKETKWANEQSHDKNKSIEQPSESGIILSFLYQFP